MVSEPADQVEEADGRQTEAGAATGTPPARPVLRGRRHGILASATAAAAAAATLITERGHSAVAHFPPGTPRTVAMLGKRVA